MVSESWFNDFSTPIISGYNLYRNDRKTGKRGGGVCIYVCEGIMSLEVCNSELYSSEVEVVWCELRCGMDNVLVGCFYRKPGAPASVGREICKVIREAKGQLEKKKYTALVIAGDFNFPRVKWIEGSGFFHNDNM